MGCGRLARRLKNFSGLGLERRLQGILPKVPNLQDKTERRRTSASSLSKPFMA
jgi:hypothetical protein